MADETDANQISERVARGFEALVDEESPAASPPPPPPPPPVTQPGGDNSAGAARLEALETRVRQTMDRLTELVEAQLPEAVDGLRADLETLRLELQTSLNEAAQQMAEERRQLRSQIATTVGAANRWFVRARDQLNDRLDEIAELASDAQSHAEQAAAAIAAATPPPGKNEQAAGEAALEWEGEPEAEVDRTPVPAAETAPERAAAAVDLAIEAPELDALTYPVRGDLQELQMEIASLGDAMRDVQAALTRLANRVPAKGVRLHPDQLELIVEAVIAALPPPPRGPARKAASKAVSAPSKSAPLKKSVATKKAPLARRTARSSVE